MKILLVCQYYYPERFTISDIASELVKNGNEVFVVTGKPNYCYGKILPEYKHIKDEAINGVNVHRVNLRPRKANRISIITNYLSYYWNAKRYVRHLKDDFDLVLSCSLSPVISIAPAKLYKEKHGVKHVLYCLDLWPESTVVTGAVKKDSLIYKLLYKWSKKLYQSCDEILLSSPSFDDYFKNVLNLSHIDTKFIPQPALLPKVSSDPIEFTNKHNVVYVGNIGKLQLMSLLVNAMKEVPAEYDLKLHLIGMGSESENIKSLIKELNLEDKVVYYGPKPIEEASRYYANADALVVSLKSEGIVGSTIPNKLTQYLYYGKSILGVISGDGRKLLEETGGAILADENVESVKNAFVKVCELEEKEKIRLGESNKRYFFDNLTLEKITYLIEEELKKLSKN